MAYLKQWSAVFVTLVMFAGFSNANENKSPCPDVFRYAKNEDGLYGVVTIPIQYTKNVNRILLKVSLLHKLPLPTTYMGHIEPQDTLDNILIDVLSQTKPIKYNVFFPYQDDYFYVKSVEINGKNLCRRRTFPEMVKLNINLLNELTFEQDKPVTPSEFSLTQPSVYQQIKSHIFNKGKRHPTTCRTLENSQCSPTTTTKTPITKMTSIYQSKPTKLPFTEMITKLHSSESRKPSSTSTTEQPERPNPDNFVKPLQRNPNENYNSVFDRTQLDFECGNANVDSPRKWPWITAVYTKGLTKLSVVSGGALISDIFIITAARPVSMFNNRPIRPEELSVRVGAFDLEDWIDKNSNPRTVREIIYHPKYNPMNIVLRDDIALLRIKPLTFNQFISPVCLIRANRNNIAQMVKGITIGWGRDLTDLLNVMPSEIEMETLPIDDCKNVNRVIPNFITPSTLCARSEAIPELCWEEPGKGFYTQRGNTEKWVLAGVLSHSLKNIPEICRITETRLFSDLTKYVGWIEEQMFRKDF